MSQGETNRIGLRQRMAMLAFAAAMFIGVSAYAGTLLDFTNDPLTGPPPVPGFVPAPFLNNSNAPAVSGYIAGQPVKALKVVAPLNAGTVATIYGSNVVNYTFSDFEGATALANTTTLRNQISAGPLPAGVFYGNYDLYPISGDATRGPGYTPPGYSAYLASGVNIASEGLYPGSFTFRTKTNDLGTSQSNAPSIRAALFALPITRFSLVQATLPLGNKHIPYVTRFNNTGNPLLSDAPTPQQPFRWSNPDGQMISRGDFKAMVAHYRLRGADGLHLLDGGVEGYSQSDFQNDAIAGWNIPKINEIFNGGGAKLATLNTTVNVGKPASSMSVEDAGLVFSGVYSLTQNAGQGKLALLVSNMVDTQRSMQIPFKIGGKSLLGDITVPLGHSLLEFTGAGTQWQLTATTPLFTSDIETDRTGVGVPEPTMMGGVALLALFGLARRRRD